MRNIIVVELGSTGVNFIRDIINRSYTPIGLQLNVGEVTEGNKEYKRMTAECCKSIDADFEIIHEKDSYEETLEMVRGYDPLLVIPASEKGVILATRLADDLNLLGNSYKNIDSLTLKDKMQEKIAESGLRHIRGQVITSVEQAVEYYDSEGLEEVVVKPTYSAGSVGMKICLNRQELIEHLTELFLKENLYGDEIEEFVIQERIKGDEYIVNTVSCDGVHRVTTMWKYHKVASSDGSYIYDYMETINDLSIGESDIVEYAYNVADALEIKYGAVHGEFMVDDKGPVLIEVNCRPMGGNMPIKFLDLISGQHETDSILDSYLNPENFEFERRRGYKLYEHGAIKYFIVPREIAARSSPIAKISNNLKSHFKTTEISFDTVKRFVKTQDLETIGGTVYLCHTDGYAVLKDIEFLRSVEKHAFQLILSDESSKRNDLDENDGLDDVKNILNMITAYGSTLFVTDNVFDEIDILQVSPDDIGNVKGEFDCVVLNLNTSILNKKDDQIAYMLLDMINKVKQGGLIFIPQSTYQYVSNGKVGVEAFIKILDLKIELPMHGFTGFIIAKKQ